MQPQVWPRNMVRILVWLDPIHSRQRASLSLLVMNSRSLPQKCESPKELLLKATDPPQGKNRTVPRGFLAVYVGQDGRRFLIPAKYLSMPDFRGLMEKAEEEFGFQQEGGLRFPCEEEDFEEILSRCREMQRRRRRRTSFGAKIMH
ncbi:hypothetical protein MLD38_008042 [Melastoma candidum]|uniref:Uncharacterized protein n=1 Tax=Melastoma candidum TaxID=119954 RepID=A0ACB9RT14_9MYRT|nr:hypothetical protein MLD38_008042 [Melastoma candidum]